MKEALLELLERFSMPQLTIAMVLIVCGLVWVVPTLFSNKNSDTDDDDLPFEFTKRRIYRGQEQVYCPTRDDWFYTYRLPVEQREQVMNLPMSYSESDDGSFEIDPLSDFINTNHSPAPLSRQDSEFSNQETLDLQENIQMQDDVAPPAVDNSPSDKNQ